MNSVLSVLVGALAAAAATFAGVVIAFGFWLRFHARDRMLVDLFSY